MKVAERTLVFLCPDWPAAAAASAAAGIPPDPARDARAFEPVVAAVEAIAPEVGVVRPGLGAFPTRGPSRYFGGDRALAAAVAEVVDGALAELAELGELTGPGATGADGQTQQHHRCRVGVADGLFAAMLAARSGTVVPAGDSATFLAPMPLATLDRPELADLLARLGIRSLGDLAALPAPDMLARFGPDGALAQRLARGLDQRPAGDRVPVLDIAATAELDPPIERTEAGAFVARGLADDLCRQLTERGLACTHLQVEAETEHGERLCRLWRHDGAIDAAAMVERVRWQLEGWLSGTVGELATRPTAGITRLRLVAEGVEPDRGRQLGFWGGVAEADVRATRALARVQGLLGHEAVVTAVVTGGREPAAQARLVPWGSPREMPGKRAAADAPGFRSASAQTPPWPGRLPPPAPSRVPPVPLPAEVTDGSGRPVGVTGRGRLGSPPVRLSVSGGSWEDVSAWAGPWPLEERWWDPSTRRRRARFQVLTAAGAAYLLAVEGGRWQVEAVYD